jgi:putative nucleotidyltransferase with HDIG domain
MPPNFLPEAEGYAADLNDMVAITSGRMEEIYQFSRQLVATNAIDVLLESVVRYAVDIVQVTFCRILTQEPDQTFSCQASFFRRASETSGQNVIDFQSEHGLQSFYDQVSRRTSPLFLHNTGPNSLLEAHILQLYKAACLCFVPMQVNTEPIGILVFGDERSETRESFGPEKIRLALLISDLAASAIHRASLSKILQSSRIETVMALVKTIEARDPYTGGHSKKMVELSVRTAQVMGLNDADIQTIRQAAYLHDIGKISVPDEILHKPGPLDQGEWLVMRKHPDIGADIILSVSKLAHVAPIVRFHHERYNGRGYPYEMEGELIPLGARIISVVDAYSAITDGRVYKPARPHNEAIAEIKRCSGSDFDPRVVEAFLRLFEHGCTFAANTDE